MRPVSPVDELTDAIYVSTKYLFRLREIQCSPYWRCGCGREVRRRKTWSEWARVDVFDRTLHKTNAGLNDLMGMMGSQDRHKAYIVLKATLHALRDRLTIEEVAQLGAQLPMLIRGFYYEGWDPSGKPVRERHRDEFIARIQRELARYEIDPGQVARAVFLVMSNRISEGEIEDVEHVLPREIRNLWPSTVPQGRPQ